ncbi:MAG: transport system permease protein [Paucimonas sp.]|jgi:phospholipid/cholesterol/gamma-HCH transport system permease protein|nr:transport system permease protein [Paucimonas sp.]
MTYQQNSLKLARMSNPQAFAPGLTRPDPHSVAVHGAWRVLALADRDAVERLEAALRALPPAHTLRWDLSGMAALDHVGAQWLWNAWGRRRPPDLVLTAPQTEVFARLEESGELALPTHVERPALVDRLQQQVRGLAHDLGAFIALVGQVMLDLLQFLRQPQRGPWREISANLFRIGFQALGITALVGFLIGIVLSYLSAQQLHTFGGDIYLVNILGMSIIRELGPLLAAILVAGRSGSSITAQIGVMRVTEELDAMLVMGLPHGFRLVLPRVLALALAMPLLVVWTDTVALLGGMTAGWLELGLTPRYFITSLPDAVPLANYIIGLFKGVVFGVLIGLVACHFGLRIAPDTDSLGRGTTSSVVTAITVVILADAVFAIVFKGVGF